MEDVIQHLITWKTELETKCSFSTVAERAEHIGLVNRIDSAIRLLKLCALHDIPPGAWFCALPDSKDLGYHQVGYHVVCDNETHDPTEWSEVAFEKHGKLLLRPGDIVIKK